MTRTREPRDYGHHPTAAIAKLIDPAPFGAPIFALRFGTMTTTIQYALLEGQIVGLSDVQRGQKGLTCFTCGDHLIVKDGQGSKIKACSPRNAPKSKHFSHTLNSQCHGEGPAHYRLKMGIAESIRMAREMRPRTAQLPRPSLLPMPRREVRRLMLLQVRSTQQL